MYLQNAPCIFVDHSYLALMACTSCQVVNLPYLKRRKYQSPTALNFSKKGATWRILIDLGWLGLMLDLPFKPTVRIIFICDSGPHDNGPLQLVKENASLCLTSI